MSFIKKVYFLQSELAKKAKTKPNQPNQTETKRNELKYNRVEPKARPTQPHPVSCCFRYLVGCCYAYFYFYLFALALPIVSEK